MRTFLVFLGVAGQVVAEPVDFVRDIQPIFARHCYSCHGAEKQKSGLRLDVREAAFLGGEFHPPTIAPGDAEGSTLVRLVRSEDADERMPAEGSRLSDDEIAKLVAWIDGGAVWPEGVDEVRLEDRRDHWSFKPLAPFDESRGIDAFVEEKLAAEGLSKSPPADPLTWLRRVYFDLTGLPPTPEQVNAFLEDSGPAARRRVVDDLLASPRYGERWAQHWLDVVRYADTHGFEVNTERPNAWPFRDYVIRAFNEDTPFDQFIREQIAGDQYGKDAATGFLVTAARLLPGQIGKDAESMRLARQDELGEIVINTGEAFLGLSIGCARCHNHKFDAITARDYYSMQAFFSGVSYGDRAIRGPENDGAARRAEALQGRLREIDASVAAHMPLVGSGVARPAVNARFNVERFEAVKARKVRFSIEKTNLYEPCIDEWEVFDEAGNNIALSSLGVIPSASGSKISANQHELEFIHDGEVGNERSWMCSETSGWVMLEFPGEHVIDRMVWSRDREGTYEDRLALEYVIEVGDGAAGWKVIASSDDRRMEGATQEEISAGLDSEKRSAVQALLEERRAVEADLEVVKRSQLVFAGQFGEPEPTYQLRRGDPEQPQEEVQPAVLSALGGPALPKDAPDARRRKVLANWIADPENPLTARVAVNRIWQGHFGMGLVETSNDFGRIGAAPSHPELLDWLASAFIRSGWSMKQLHRLIVLSSTYGQSAEVRPAAQAKDADVRLLWRYPSRRLEAEAIRDSILAVSGRLNLKTGGAGFNLFESRGGLSGFPPVKRFEEEGRRRMIYAHKVRMEPDAVFGAFDCPDAGQSVARRRQSTTPLQALNLFNSVFVLDEAEALAERARTEACEDDVASQIRRIYALALGRDPGAEELADATSVVTAHGLSTFSRAILNSNEFLFIP